jgi:hypothetical protein
MIELNALNFNIFLGVLSLIYLGYLLLQYRKIAPVVDFGYFCTAVDNKEFLIMWSAPSVDSDSSTVSWTQAPIVKYSLKNTIGYDIVNNSTDLLFDSLYKGIIVKRVVVQNLSSTPLNFSLVTRGTDGNFIANSKQIVISNQIYSGEPVYISFDTTNQIKYRLDWKSDPSQDQQGGISILINTDDSVTPGPYYSLETFICLVCEMDMSIS